MNIEPVIEQALQIAKPKKSLAEMLYAIEQMESVMNEMDVITQDVVQSHFDSIEAIDEKTDKLIGFMERMKMESAQASEKAEAYKEKSKAHENALESCKQYCKWLLKRFPDIEYRGKKGKLVLQRIQPKLIINTPQHRFSSEKVIPDDQIFAIPLEFRTCKVIWVYNSDGIREILKTGVESSIARLEENSSVRTKLI
jgi:hypothetical protein